MITDSLTNRVYLSSLLSERCPVLNAHIVDVLQQHEIPYAYLSGTKDIWCRDYLPIQIEKDRYVLYKYTPDYLQDRIGLTLQTKPEKVFQTDCFHFIPERRSRWRTSIMWKIIRIFAL